MKKYFFLFLFSNLFLFTFTIAQVPGACGSSKKNLSPLNGNLSLGQTYNNSACGLNYVYDTAHIETRYFGATASLPGCGGSCSWTISGLPAYYVVDRAYVWALTSYVDPTPPSGSVTITNPASSISTYAPATGTAIGTDASKCWGETGSATYRYDVTPSISGNGTYDFSFSGFTGTPVGYFTSPFDQIDGATLFIIYHDLNATYQGTLDIWDGAIVGIGTTSSMTMTGLNVCATPTSARAFTISSDHQPNVGATHQTSLNGVPMNFSNIMYDEDQAPVTLTSGQTTCAFDMDGSGGSDCYLWGVMGLYYQTTICTVCTPCLTTTVTIDSVINASSCSANSGAVYISVSSSAQPLTYTWSNGATTQDITGLAPGNYSVTVNDTSGCSINLYAAVNSPSSILVSLNTLTNVSCFGGNNGAVFINVSGGTAPFTYSWSNGATTKNAIGLHVGSYSVVVTDAGGCVKTFSATVSGAPMLVMNLNATPSSCYNCPDGSVFSNVFGGTPPYSYSWSNGQNAPNCTGLLPGNYVLCVTDGNNCVVCDSVSVNGLGVNELFDNSSVNVSPNPFSETTTISFINNKSSIITLKIYDVYGREVNPTVIHNLNSFVIHRDNLSLGMYFYKLIKEDGRYATGKFVIE